MDIQFSKSFADLVAAACSFASSIHVPSSECIHKLRQVKFELGVLKLGEF